MTYTLYYWPTPNAHKITLFLEEAELTYEIKSIDITKGEQFNEDFLNIAPNNRIPALTHQRSKQPALHLFESGAILQYLAETHQMLLPEQGDRRYHALQWLYWQMGGLGPMAGQNHHFNIYAPEKIPYAIDRYVTETKRLHRVLDKQLSRNEYVAGESLTIADLAIYPWVVPWQQQAQDIDKTPHLKRWMEHIANRSSTKKAYAIAERFKSPKTLDEQSRKILFPSTTAPN